MTNLTLFSLCAHFLFSSSPFYLLNRYHQSFLFCNSYLSRSFSSIIFSNSHIQKTLIHTNIFSHALKSSIFLNNSEDIILNSLKTDQSQRFTETSREGNITIVNCIFENCRSEVGGALYITQNCSVTIYGTTFKKCYAYEGSGGYISQYYNFRDSPKDSNEFISVIKIEYCCFFECFAHNLRDDNESIL